MKKLGLALIALSLTSCIPLLNRGEKTKPRPLPPPQVSQVQKPTPKERAEGYYQIGLAYLEIGEVPLALNYLFKAEKLNPKDPKIYNAIGLAFIRRGNYQEAEKYLRRALKLKPNFSEAWLNLGILYEEKGELKKAKEFYEKALSNPLYLTPEVAYYRLALLALKEGKTEEAKNYLILAIRNNTDYAPAYIELAKLLEKEGEDDKAKDIYFRLTSLYPNLQYPYCALGELFLKEGDEENGVKYLKECINVNPSSELAAKARREISQVEGETP